MSEKNKKLSSNAYGGIKGEEYVPFIPTSEVMPETTGYSIIIGIIFACVFAAANTYLGLKVGMTISAGIPGAILATGLLKGAFKRNSILEANMIASLAAMGESIAGGIIFVLPALILLAFGLSIMQVVIVTVVGGIMGVFFITPLRRFLIVEEHGELVFPEAMAAAEVLVAGSVGGSGFNTVVTGIGVGGVYKFISGGLRFWPETATYTFTSYQGTQIGLDALASLLGVGFIIGTKVSALMFGGGLIAWFGLIPLIKFMSLGLEVPIFPGTIPIAEMSASEVWSNYIRYIGTGAVATGGIISLVGSLPTIIGSFKQAIGGLGGKDSGKVERINLEAPFLWVVGAAVFGFFGTWLIPAIGGGVLGGIAAVLFSFFFAVVSARMVGIIGASSNPVSGMTIATLLVVTTLLRITGRVGDEGIKSALLISGVVCVAIAVAGGTAQSLKTTFIIGGTPKSVQIGMFVALSIASIVAGGVVLLLNSAYEIGSAEAAAPQASLMRLIVEGIMTAQLPWTLVIIGAAIAVFCALASIPILPVALGIYLPISLSSPVLIGGIISKIVEDKFKDNKERKDSSIDRGVLLASGLVAGDALIGILIAILAVLEVNIGIGATLFPDLAESSLLSFIMFLALGTWVYLFSIKKTKEVK